MNILQAESSPMNIMSKILKFAVLVSQLSVPSIRAYKNISVSIDGSYTALKGAVYVSIDGGVSKRICTAEYDDWKTASVVCRDLGHGPPLMTTAVYDSSVSDYYYGPKVFPCSGKEKSLLECTYSSYGYYQYCSYSFLEVECLPSSSHDYDIRLVSDTGFGNSGTALVFYGGRWGPVCSYDNQLPDVICKQLGYSYDGGYSSFDEEVDVFENPVLSIDDCSAWDASIEFCSFSKWYSWDSYYCSTVTVYCYQSDSSYEDESSASAAAGFSVVLVFLIIMCCTGVICCALCRKKNRSSREPVAMTNVTSGAAAPLQSQEPVVHPPPPPYKDVVGPTTEGPPPPVYHPNMGYPPAPTYPTAPGLGYPTAPGPGYPTPPGPGYPPASGSGYPASSPGYPPAPSQGYQHGPGYPTAPGPGYPTAPGPGYPSAPGQSYPSAPAPGYPSAPAPGYPSASGPGYPPALDPGNIPPKSSGYLPGSGSEYQSVPPPSFAPVADDSSRITQTDDEPPTTGGQGSPAPSAPPASTSE